MHPTLLPRPFHHDGWVYEEKIDGYRMVAYKDDEGVRLVSRTGRDHTRRDELGEISLRLSSKVADELPRATLLTQDLVLWIGEQNGCVLPVDGHNSLLFDCRVLCLGCAMLVCSQPSGRPAPDGNALEASPRAAVLTRAWTWPALMHRVFALDVLACPRCGGRRRVIA